MTDSALVHLWQTQLRIQADLFRAPARRAQSGARARSAEELDRLFLDLVTLVEPDLFVEAGAFEAEMSLRVAREFPDCNVIAFEANPDNYAYFANARRFAERGVQYLNLALADVAGPITFHVESDAGSTIIGSSSTLARNEARDAGRLVTVDGVLLDEYTPEAERVAMWVDVEGAADRVLRGAKKRLASCDVLKVEVEELQFWEGQALAIDVLDQLLEVGLVPIARDIEFPSQYNLVFASPRLLRQQAALERIENFLATIREREPWPIVSRARAHPLYGKASSAVRGALRGI